MMQAQTQSTVVANVVENSQKRKEQCLVDYKFPHTEDTDSLDVSKN